MIATSLNTPIPPNHQLVFICTSSRCVSCLLVWWYLMAVPLFALELSLSQRLQWGWLHLVSWCLYSCLVLSCLVLSCLVLSCLVLSCLVLSAIQPASQSASQPACQPACQPSNQAAVTPRCINHRVALAGACGEPEFRSTCFPIEVLTFCLSKWGRFLRSRMMALAGFAVSMSSEVLFCLL
jgi:hypothetical protein